MNSHTAQLKRLLLADDDEDDRIFFREALEEIPVSTSLNSVKDGEELMKVLQHDGVVPDMLFLDLNMPGRDGKECLREIRMFTHLKALPVIIFSTSANQRDVEEAFLLGADLYLQKPSGYTLMVQQLEKVLNIDWGQFVRDRKAFFFS
jgi:CheY-like chemotaxis protein